VRIACAQCKADNERWTKRLLQQIAYTNTWHGKCEVLRNENNKLRKKLPKEVVEELLMPSRYQIERDEALKKAHLLEGKVEVMRLRIAQLEAEVAQLRQQQPVQTAPRPFDFVPAEPEWPATYRCTGCGQIVVRGHVCVTFNSG